VRRKDYVQESTARILDHSPVDDLRETGKKEERVQKDPVWRDGYVFFGWSLGDSDELENLIDRERNQDPSQSYSQMKRKAIRKLCRKIEQRDPSANRKVWIDRSEPDVMFIPGARGSGKSFIIRAMTDRVARTGDTKQLVLDVEHEYFSSNKFDGVQDDFFLLRNNEEKQPVDTKVLMPEFIYQARERGDESEEGYQWMDRFKFSFSDLDADSINFLIRESFDDESPDLDIFGSQWNQEREKGNIQEWDDVRELAIRMEEEGRFSWHERINRIKSVIDSKYKGKEFFGEGRDIDLAQVFNDYNRVALSFEAGEVNEKLKMKELYTYLMVKKIRNLKQEGAIEEPVRFVLEEAHELIPSKTDPEYPPSKKQIRRVIKRDRKRGLSVTMASQEPSDVQEKNFLSQARYFLVPQNLGEQQRKDMLELAGVWRSGDKRANKFRQITDSMPEFSWLFCDSDKNSWTVVVPASPISRHYTSG
jgi:hypothetical protein